jgi:hypothetical protein
MWRVMPAVRSNLRHNQRNIHLLSAHPAMDANVHVLRLAQPPVFDCRIAFEDQRVIADALVQPRMRRAQVAPSWLTERHQP